MAKLYGKDAKKWGNYALVLSLFSALRWKAQKNYFPRRRHREEAEGRRGDPERQATTISGSPLRFAARDDGEITVGPLRHVQNLSCCVTSDFPEPLTLTRTFRKRKELSPPASLALGPRFQNPGFCLDPTPSTGAPSRSVRQGALRAGKTTSPRRLAPSQFEFRVRADSGETGADTKRDRNAQRAVVRGRGGEQVKWTRAEARFAILRPCTNRRKRRVMPRRVPPFFGNVGPDWLHEGLRAGTRRS